MIINKYALKNLCEADMMPMQNARIVLLNYIYYTKSVVCTDVLTANITNIETFEKMMTVACNYFLTLP